MRDPNRSRLRTRRWLAIGLLLMLIVVLVLGRHRFASLPNMRARQLLTHHRADAALTWLRFSRRLSSSNGETEFLLAVAYRRLDKYSEAVGHLQRATDLAWPQVQLDREYWLLKAQSGQIRESLPQLPYLLQQAGTDGPEICQAYVRGMMRTNNKLQTAYELLSVWSSDYPEDPLPHYLLAQLSNQFHDWKNSEQQLQRALELNAEHHAAALALGQLLVKRQRPRDALSRFSQASAGSDVRAEAFVGQATCLRLLGDLDAAGEAVGRARSLQPELVAAMVEQARVHVAAGNSDAAAKVLEEAVGREPNNADACHELGIVLRGLNQPQPSGQYLEKAAGIRAQLSLVEQLTQDALRDPGNLHLRIEAARILLELGRREQALPWVQGVLDTAPGHPTANQLAKEHALTRHGYN